MKKPSLFRRTENGGVFVDMDRKDFGWHGVRNSEPSIRSPHGFGRVDQVTLCSRRGLQRGVATRSYVAEVGTKGFEPATRLAASWSNRTPLPLVAIKQRYYGILRFERSFSSPPPYQTKEPRHKPRVFCWHGVRDSEPATRLAASWSNCSPRPWGAIDLKFVPYLAV